MLQKTIKDEVRLCGKGLFGGEEVKAVFRPAEVDAGVVFVRTDLAERIVIPALAANIAEMDRRTALKNGEASVETPEHCLAAISALGITNLLVEVEGGELPGFDGSCEAYFKALLESGIVDQAAECKELAITESVSIT